MLTLTIGTIRITVDVDHTPESAAAAENGLAREALARQIEKERRQTLAVAQTMPGFYMR